MDPILKRQRQSLLAERFGRFFDIPLSAHSPGPYHKHPVNPSGG
jgi:hypothetical protein